MKLKFLSFHACALYLLTFVFILPSYANPTISTDSSLHENDSIGIISGTGKAAIGISNNRSAVKKNISISNERFSKFNQQYDNHWLIINNPKKAAQKPSIKLLYGFKSKSYQGQTVFKGQKGSKDIAKQVAIGFLRDTYEMFGLDHELSNLSVNKVNLATNRNHIRFQQTHLSIPVVGAELIVHANKDGQVTMVQNGIESNIDVVNEDVLSEQQAIDIARSSLTQKLSQNVELSQSQAKKVIKHFAPDFRYSWKITTSTTHPFGYWIHYIDTQTGEILYQGDEINSLATGRGRGFKKNKHYHNNNTTKVDLKAMFTSSEGYTKGFLWGLHADVYDNNGNDPYSAKLKFIYDPLVEKDYFDATQAYYKLHKTWVWWKKKVVNKYGPVYYPLYFNNYAVPTYVNVIGMCNAFFSPDIDSGFPGMAFGDQNACYAGSEDLVLDDDIFRHEYTHAMMNWLGFTTQFGGDVHGYGRSMGEGNADWFAFLADTKDSKLADVSFPPFLRDLNNTRIYPDDVNYPSWGMPEEHWTGEIWGGFLFDLYSSMGLNKKKKSIRYVYESFNYFTSTDGHRPGEADFLDAVWAMHVAEQDLHGTANKSIKAWGAMASRGLNGFIRTPYSHASNYFNTAAAGSDSSNYIYFSFPPIKKANTKGYMLNNGDIHEYIIDITEPITRLKVIVKSAKNDGIINPFIKLYDTSLNLLTSVQELTINKAKLINETVPPGRYIITVEGGTMGRGKYTFKIKIVI